MLWVARDLPGCVLLDPFLGERPSKKRQIYVMLKLRCNYGVASKISVCRRRLSSTPNISDRSLGDRARQFGAAVVALWRQFALIAESDSQH